MEKEPGLIKEKWLLVSFFVITLYLTLVMEDDRQSEVGLRGLLCECLSSY